MIGKGRERRRGVRKKITTKIIFDTSVIFSVQRSPSLVYDLNYSSTNTWYKPYCYYPNHGNVIEAYRRLLATPSTGLHELIVFLGFEWIWLSSPQCVVRGLFMEHSPHYISRAHQLSHTPPSAHAPHLGSSRPPPSRNPLRTCSQTPGAPRRRHVLPAPEVQFRLASYSRLALHGRTPER